MHILSRFHCDILHWYTFKKIFVRIFSLNTFRLWQPQLFATIHNFDNLNTNITNPTFCEILDISTSADVNKTAAFVETSSCEKVRYSIKKLINILKLKYILDYYILLFMIWFSDCCHRCSIHRNYYCHNCF